jgi:hypothetical protein
MSGPRVLGTSIQYISRNRGSAPVCRTRPPCTDETGFVVDPYVNNEENYLITNNEEDVLDTKTKNDVPTRSTNQ